MTDFDKMCAALDIEISNETKECILIGSETLVFFWNKDGSLRDWGIL